MYEGFKTEQEHEFHGAFPKPERWKNLPSQRPFTKSHSPIIKCGLACRLHRRLIVSPICKDHPPFGKEAYPLHMLGSSPLRVKLYLQIPFSGSHSNVNIGHRELWMSGFLHRDISPGNMLYDPATKTGILADLDTAKEKTDTSQAFFRSANAAFMAIGLL